MGSCSRRAVLGARAGGLAATRTAARTPPAAHAALVHRSVAIWGVHQRPARRSTCRRASSSLRRAPVLTRMTLLPVAGDPRVLHPRPVPVPVDPAGAGRGRRRTRLLHRRGRRTAHGDARRRARAGLDDAARDERNATRPRRARTTASPWRPSPFQLTIVYAGRDPALPAHGGAHDMAEDSSAPRLLACPPPCASAWTTAGSTSSDW